MGTYNLSAEEIADKLDILEFEASLEGDFYFEDFILGAIIYLKRLKRQGAFIFSDKKKIIKKFEEDLK